MRESILDRESRGAFTTCGVSAAAAAPSLASRKSGFSSSMDDGKGGRGRRPSRHTLPVGSLESRHDPSLRSSMDERISLKMELVREFGRILRALTEGRRQRGRLRAIASLRTFAGRSTGHLIEDAPNMDARHDGRPVPVMAFEPPATAGVAPRREVIEFDEVSHSVRLHTKPTFRMIVGVDAIGAPRHPSRSSAARRGSRGARFRVPLFRRILGGEGRPDFSAAKRHAAKARGTQKQKTLPRFPEAGSLVECC